MKRLCASVASALVLASLAATTSSAQQTGSEERTTTTGGLALGLSGMKSSDGTTTVGDIMWTGAEMMDGVGIRFTRQGLAPRSHGYAAMIVIGGPPHDSISWLRIDFGLGYVGQQSDRSLRWYRRHGVGAQFGATIAPVKFGIVRPELNGWGVAGTSAQFLGVSLGVRILDPRQH